MQKKTPLGFYDACKVLGINGSVSLDTVKHAYRLACSKFHPDKNPAGLEMMKAVNAAYNLLKTSDFDQDYEVHHKAESFTDDLNDALNHIIGCSGLNIEICGSWLWVGGETRTHKDTIKQFVTEDNNKFHWAPKKSKWYFRPSDYKSKGRGKFSMEDIRNTYGSRAVNTTQREQLNA